MRNLILTVMVLGTSISAFASSSYHTEVRCSVEPPRMDASLSAEILAYTGPSTIGREPSLSAKVTEWNIIAHEQTQNYYGLKRIDPTGVGGSTFYKGEGFELELYTDSAPTADGKIRAQMTYEWQGARNTVPMACELLRHMN